MNRRLFTGLLAGVRRKGSAKLPHTYAQREALDSVPQDAGPAGSGPTMAELAAGASPTAEQMGHRLDLPDRIRTKMENAFGADFSNVKLYESDTAARADAQGLMAARGESVYSGPVAPVGASAAATASGPMQAAKDQTDQ